MVNITQAIIIQSHVMSSSFNEIKSIHLPISYQSTLPAATNYPFHLPVLIRFAKVSKASAVRSPL